jgi:hypothetical protein
MTRLPKIIQADRDALADAWETWRGEEGVTRKLRAGDDFMSGSPIFCALVAIATVREELTGDPPPPPKVWRA